LEERSSIVTVGRTILPAARIPVLDPDAIDAPLAIGSRKWLQSRARAPEREYEEAAANIALPGG
jgi:hypothetical protein